MKRMYWYFLPPAVFFILLLVPGCNNNGVGAPPVPSAFAVSLDNNRPVLTWGAAGDGEVSGYKIERKITGGEYSSLAADVSGATTSYTDHDAVPDTTYAYHICACSEAGDSEWTESIETRVLSESEIQVTDIGGTVLTNNGTAIYLGTYTQGSTATTVSLPVKNTGTSALRIQNTIDENPDGSVILTLNDYDIETGYQTTLDVRASTATVGTNIAASIYMQTNDETDRTYVINFLFTIN